MVIVGWISGTKQRDLAPNHPRLVATQRLAYYPYAHTRL